MDCRTTGLHFLKALRDGEEDAGQRAAFATGTRTMQIFYKLKGCFG